MKYRTTLDRLIIALAVLLCMAVLALTGVKVYKQVVLSNEEPPSNVIEHNVIKEEGSEGNQSDDVVANESNDNSNSSVVIGNNNNTGNANQGYLIETDSEASVRFYEMHMNYNEKFHLENLFPGDSYNKGYAVTVNHIGPIDVKFHVVVDPQYQLLANALQIRMIYNGSVIHEGSLQNFTYIARLNSNVETRDVLDYQVQVYLPTSADNTLQEQECNADFYWTADEVIDEVTGETGKLVPDTASVLDVIIENDYIYYGLILIVLGTVCILMWGRRHEEDR